MPYSFWYYAEKFGPFLSEPYSRQLKGKLRELRPGPVESCLLRGSAAKDDSVDQLPQDDENNAAFRDQTSGEAHDGLA
jgi:hypothetical protein